MSLVQLFFIPSDLLICELCCRAYSVPGARTRDLPAEDDDAVQGENDEVGAMDVDVM